MQHTLGMLMSIRVRRLSGEPVTILVDRRRLTQDLRDACDRASAQDPPWAIAASTPAGTLYRPCPRDYRRATQ